MRVGRFVTIWIWAAGLVLIPAWVFAMREQAEQEPAREQTTATLVIRVKLVADAREPTTPKKWEERLRQRLTAASAITERVCGIRFEPVALDTWDGDPAITSMQEAIREFSGKVRPDPADVAIGFTAKLRQGPACNWLGVTTGALSSHILVREWNSVQTENERLEVLVHELGHYLGAAHSPDPDSVMRPRLGDAKARRRSFQIDFDPPNSRILHLFAGAISGQEFRSVVILPPATRSELEAVYSEIDRTLPADPVAAAYLKQLGSQSGKAPEVVPRTNPLVQATRQVLDAMIESVEPKRKELLANSSDSRSFGGPSDRLAELCFREAAAGALKVPKDQAVAAYLLAIGIAADDSSLLRKNLLTRNLWMAIENESDRTRRIEAIGRPTLCGRHDLAQHFVVSAALAAIYGPRAARELGLIKEMSDAQGGSGFSFADLAADLAGIAFADALRAEHLSLEDLSQFFSMADFMPALDGLLEGLSWSNFVREYGSFSDPRFRAEESAIVEKIRALPGMRKTSGVDQ